MKEQMASETAFRKDSVNADQPTFPFVHHREEWL